MPKSTTSMGSILAHRRAVGTDTPSTCRVPCPSWGTPLACRIPCPSWGTPLACRIPCPSWGTPLACRIASLWLAALLLALAAPAHGQFVESETGSSAPTLGDARTLKYRVGLEVLADGGALRNVYATMPVPADWPEQKVQIFNEDLSPDVRSLRYRMLPGGVKQMVVEIPDLPAGTKAHAIVTFSLERSAILPPEQTASLAIPEKPDRALRTFLSASPYIETRHPKIMKLAKTTGEGLEGWAKVERLYDKVREKVEYRNGDLKGAARALADGWGDCEELTCLFIAVARIEGIPARTVWVEGHCYPEFYLVDAEGKGHWFPCQAAGARAFGGMPDQLPILQKGDSFRDPDRPGKSLRYVSEFIRGASANGNGTPRVRWIREPG